MFKKVIKKAPIALDSDPAPTEAISIVTQPAKKRPRGLGVQALEPPRPKPEDFPLIHKVFVKSSEKIEAMQNRHMEAFIQQRLSQTDSDPALALICEKLKAEQPPPSEDEETLYKVPKRFQADDSIYETAAEKTNWLSGLAEVPLTIEHKLDNIELTENSKRRVLKAGGPVTSRFEDIHYDEVEAFHSRRIKTKVDEELYTQLEKEFKLTRRDRKLSEAQRRVQNRIVEEKGHQ